MLLMKTDELIGSVVTPQFDNQQDLFDRLWNTSEKYPEQLRGFIDHVLCLEYWNNIVHFIFNDKELFKCAVCFTRLFFCAEVSFFQHEFAHAYVV
jgi:hypothetical protein